MTAVVPEQLVAAERVALLALVPDGDGRDGARRVADQKHVEIAVAVIVEERGLRRIAGVGESVLRGHLPESRHAVLHALIDVQGVGAQRANTLYINQGVQDGRSEEPTPELK